MVGLAVRSEVKVEPKGGDTLFHHVEEHDEVLRFRVSMDELSLRAFLSEAESPSHHYFRVRLEGPQ